MKIHHIGYLVKDINKSTEAFEKLGLKKYTDICFDRDRDSDICFLGENHEIELVQPHKESGIYPLLKQFTNAPYHVCYEVEDIDNAIQEYVSKGFLLFKEKTRANAISSQALVAFLIHAKIGIIELVQM